MLIHYIIVRRDLPLGVLAAMVTHAAGESAAEFERSEGWRYTGCNGPFEGCTAVVLESANEAALTESLTGLKEAKIDHVAVYESSGTYRDQLMAIGIVPGSSDSLRPRFVNFNLLS